MRIILIILIFTSFIGSTQVELAIQKGHSSSISQLEFSQNSELLLSFGDNNEGIVWDIKLSKALTNFKLPKSTLITGIKFVDEDKKIKLQSENTTYYFDLESDKMTSQLSDQDSVFRSKTYYKEKDSGYVVSMDRGGIRKGLPGKTFAKYWLSINYTRADFTSFDISLEHNIIIATGEDNVIYGYDYKLGKLRVVLSAHNSPARDVRFSPDGKHLATAGEDRSVIIWSTENYSQEKRLFSNVYRKNTASFSHDGKQIYVGDELGILYSIDFGAAFPTTYAQSNLQSINKIVKGDFEGKPGYFICNSNNSVEFKYALKDEKAVKKYNFREHAFLQTKDLLLQNHLGLYQEPFGEVTTLEFSPNRTYLLFTGKSDIPNITISSIEGRESQHLYAYDDYRSWSQARFLTDSTFIGLLENSGKLYFWRKEKKTYHFKVDSLPFVINDFTVLNENELWLSSEENGQYLYQIKSRIFEKISDVKGNKIFTARNWIVLNDIHHSIVFLNRTTYEIEAKFIGHTEDITDIDFHPTREVFITSSNDGTVRLWNLNEEALIASIIPFKNNELVIVTADNYYLISKGAFNEIGFKYEGHFFYPDQFDLKFNRPDIVLERLGYTNPELIAAYHRAYEKRLKKLNFTEEELSTSFHLPVLEVLNKSEIPNLVDNKELTLKLEMTDTKDKLDSYNVWINDVAVLGSKGENVREQHVSKLNKEVALNLGYGENKIEVSVLNQSGAESYKEVLNVFCTDGKEKPDAYIVTIGVSEYKDKKYNLAYAAKDATDIENLFIGNEYFGTVSTKAFTDDAVTLENLANIATFLGQAEVDDLVMIFVAGHGVLDNDFNYYFASYDMDFNNPGERGIPYEKIEQLLDGIKALKKLLILDTCHSGELDKEEIEQREDDENEDPGNWDFRGVGVDVAYKEDPLGFGNTNNLMKSLFLDLRRGTGATVIASSGGAELAIESSKYENGLFTYCLIDALNNEKADLDKNNSITISELQIYVTNEVKRLSNGLQVPTSRIQNKELDYRLW